MPVDAEIIMVPDLNGSNKVMAAVLHKYLKDAREGNIHLLILQMHDPTRE